MGKRSRNDDNSSQSSNDSTFSSSKIIELESGGANENRPITVIQCSLPPHRQLTFTSPEALDLHFKQEHTNRCASCGKNFPSTHFLNLHLDENHNPFREELAAKGERTYACFIEDCERKCSSAQKRRLHLIDKHMFPKMYDFRIVDTGIDKSVSLLKNRQKGRLSITSHRRRSSLTTSSYSTPDTQVSSSDLDIATTAQGMSTMEKGRVLSGNLHESIDVLEKSMAALQFVPPSVRMKQKPHHDTNKQEASRRKLNIM